MNIYEMNIGQKIKKLRLEKRMTQQELANKVNRSLRTIQLYESCKIEPRREILSSIYKALDNNTCENLNNGDVIDIALNDSLIKQIVINMTNNNEISITKLEKCDFEFITRMVKQSIINSINSINIKNDYLSK